jgi:surface carbohydrate biosynthesis protein
MPGHIEILRNEGGNAPNLYLMIEVAKRELDARLLLAGRAVKAGYRVVIGQQWLMNEYLPQFTPGVVLFKGINLIQGHWMKRARDFGHRVAAINEEALALASKVSLALETRQEILDEIDLLFAQGNNERDAYIENFKDVAQRIAVTGNARIELLRPEHRERQFPARDEIRHAFGRFILVNTNFGYINTEFGMPQDFLAHCVRVGVLNPTKPEELQLYEDRFIFERENMKAFCTMIPALKEAFPEHTLVVRPHPSENHETWRRLVGHVPGVVITGEGAPVPWILASEFLVHNTCTTGLEALLLGQPVAAFSPFTNIYENELSSNQVTPRVDTLDALFEMVKAALCDPQATVRSQTESGGPVLAHHYQGAFDGRETEKIFNEIKVLIENMPSGPLLKDGEALDPNAPFPEQQKTRVSLTTDELIERFHTINRDGPRPSALMVERLGESLFSIRAQPR